MPDQQYTQDSSRADDTTREDGRAAGDEWTGLGDEQLAALWRGLDALQVNLAAQLRQARAAVQAGKLDKLVDAVELAREGRRALEQLASSATEDETIAQTLGELAGAYWTRAAEQREATPTGLGDLDWALGGGLQPGRLVALLGAPGKGKTTLANQIAEHVANSGRPVVYVTMEDPAWVLLAKTVARVGQLDYSAVLMGRNEARTQINVALAQVEQRQSAQRLLYVDLPGRLDLAELQALAAKHFDAYGGRGLLVVDYLQRAARAAMPAGVQSELRLAVSSLTDRLRIAARELDCTVLAIASQNRAGYGANGAGALASAKESGDIEYGVDVLAAIGEDPGPEGDPKYKRVPPMGCEAYVLQLAKNRQGLTKTIKLDWMPARQQFTRPAE